MGVFKKSEITHPLKLQSQTINKNRKQYLPVRELNPGLPRDRRGY